MIKTYWWPERTAKIDEVREGYYYKVDPMDTFVVIAFVALIAVGGNNSMTRHHDSYRYIPHIAVPMGAPVLYCDG